jgi:hypothetical protein
MKNVTRTVWGAALQTYQLPGLPFVTPVNTTLNELYNVQAGVQPAKTPTLGYMAIGNGAHVAATGTNGFPLMLTVPHFCTDAALFNGIPFCMRLLTADLTPQQMAAYGMRVVKTINALQYACYYLKVIDLSGVAPQIMYNAVANGVTTATPYAATSANINPVKPTISSGGVVQTSADYLTVQMVLDLSFTENDVAELVNVATIIYGSAEYAIISEIAICSGVQAAEVGTGSAGSFTYTEVLGCQVHSFVTDFISVGDTDQGFDFDIDLGAAEPLLTVTAQTGTSGVTTSS